MRRRRKRSPVFLGFFMHLLMAWRNIWRNPRRTAVIMMAVVIGVWSMVFLGALMRGIADQMVRNGIATLTGHIQVHHRGYRRDPVVEHSISHPEAVTSVLGEILPPGSRWAARVRVNAIASNARHAEGVTLVGIDAIAEAAVSFIGAAVVSGGFLGPEEANGILVGKALADKFETRLDRKLVLMSQDAAGEIASRAFRIIGIFRGETEAIEKQFVFVHMPAAQEMLGLEGRVSEFSIVLPSGREVEGIAKRMRHSLSSTEFEVHTWREILPLVTAVLNLYDGFIFLWFVVVFIAMGFGIVNTTLMAVFERIREFGLLKALGMKPLRILREVLTESFLIITLGMIAGNLFGLLSVLALSGSGIDLSALAEGAEFAGISRVIFPVLTLRDLAAADLVVLVLGLLVSVFPALKAARLTPVEALSHT